MKALLFIVFKVVEISLIVFVPYWVGGFNKIRETINVGDKYKNKLDRWFSGFLIMLLIAGITTTIVLIIMGLIQSNLWLVNNIVN